MGLLQHNPVRQAWQPPLSREKKPACSEEEVRETLRLTEGTPLETVYRLAFCLGLRRAEICSLTWEDIDLQKGTVLVRGTKTEGSTTILPIHSDLRDWLSTRRSNGPVLKTKTGEAFHPCSLQTLLCRSRKKGLKLPCLHRGRHTLASILVAKGADIFSVSQLLRQSSVQTTQLYYAHSSPVNRRDQLELFKV